jgi:hypothetical protein
MNGEIAPLEFKTDGPLDEWLCRVSLSLEEGFVELGGLVPLLFVVATIGDAHVIGVPFTNRDNKDAYDLIGTWAREHLSKCGAVRYAFACESRHQEHKLVSIEAADYGSAISGIREIVRSKNGKPYLGPLEPIDSQGFFRGRLLPTRGRLQ